jgi:hypothetical protein
VDLGVLALSVRAFTLWEVLVMSIVAGLGVAFVTWLLAGYYERRGTFGKR